MTVERLGGVMASSGREELRELLFEHPDGQTGIVKLLNCQFDEATDIFKDKHLENPFCAAGLTFTTVVQYLTSFEDQHKSLALHKLKEVETSCGSDSGHYRKVLKGFLKSLPINSGDKIYADIAGLNLDIIAADAYLYSAIITTLNMDLSSYIKAGWLIRKAWRLYETSHGAAEILHERHFYPNIRTSQKTDTTVEFLCDKCVDGSNNNSPSACSRPAATTNGLANGTVTSGATPFSAVLEIDITDMTNGVSQRSTSFASSSPFLTPDESANPPERFDDEPVEYPTCCQCNCWLDKLNWINNGTVDKEELRQRAELSYMVDKLLADVSFGFGLFHLCMSILSPQIVRVISFFGFASDRRLGLKCLKLASRKRTMKGPLATLTLLWFHCIARPFFGLDTAAVHSVINDAERILSSVTPELSSTVLCLYFRGKVERLRCDLEVAINTYMEALAKSGGQRELRLISQYELGWCFMLLLRWDEALAAFKELKEQSKWSPSYYAYLSGLCSGAAGQYLEAIDLMVATIKAVQKKNNQIEAFVMHQAKRLVAQSKIKVLNSSVYILQIIELMYLWRSLPQCSADILGRLLNECNKVSESHFIPLKCLLEGSIFAQLGRHEIATQCLEECLARVEGLKEEKHIAAFASYEIGVLLCLSPQTKERGKVMLYAAKDKYKGYDFENRLSMRVNAAIKNFCL